MHGTLPRLVLGGSILLGAVCAIGCRCGADRREERQGALRQQILAMALEKRPADEVIGRIRSSHLAFRITSAEVKDLLDKGVDPRVVDELILSNALYPENYHRYQHYPYPPYWGIDLDRSRLEAEKRPSSPETT